MPADTTTAYQSARTLITGFILTSLALSIGLFVRQVETIELLRADLAELASRDP